GDAVAGAAEATVVVELDAGADQEGRLPRGAARTLTAGGLGGDVDGVGADDRSAAELEPGARHLKADQRDDGLDLAGLRLGALLDLGHGRGEALILDREVGAAVPEASEEVGDREVRALDCVERRRDPGLLEVGAGDVGATHRLGGLVEALEL